MKFRLGRFLRYAFLAFCALGIGLYLRAQEHSDADLVTFDVSGIVPEYSWNNLAGLKIPLGPDRVLLAADLQREKAAWIQTKIGAALPVESTAKGKRNSRNFSHLLGNRTESWTLRELTIQGQRIYNWRTDAGPGPWYFSLVLFLFFLILPFVQSARENMSSKEREKLKNFNPHTAVFRKEYWKSRIYLPFTLILLGVTLLMACYELYLRNTSILKTGAVTEIQPPASGINYFMLDIKLNDSGQIIPFRADPAEMRRGKYVVGSPIHLLYNPNNPGSQYISDYWIHVWCRTLCLGLLAGIFSVISVALLIVEHFGGEKSKLET